MLQVEVDEQTQTATITNRVDNSSIEDDLADSEDNTETLTVSDELLAATRSRPLPPMPCST